MAGPPNHTPVSFAKYTYFLTKMTWLASQPPASQKISGEKSTDSGSQTYAFRPNCQDAPRVKRRSSTSRTIVYPQSPFHGCYEIVTNTASHGRPTSASARSQ